MEQIGRYRIVSELGHGTMGTVYRAVDPSIGRPIAIKVIPIHDLADSERLFSDARSAGVLSHPNIVTIYDMDEVDGFAYIAMAYVNGPSLEKILSSEEPLSGANMLRLLRQSAQALDYAHGKGIVHGDIRPANVMTDEDGSVKITDFGIAKSTVPPSSGAPYVAPELAQAENVDGRSDQFSLAAIAYEVLTGERPAAGEEPAPANKLNATLTEHIDEVLRKALARNPEDRFTTCSNFVGALDLACAESRGWKTLPANAPIVMQEIPAPEPQAEGAGVYAAPDFASLGAPEKKRSSSMWPFLLSALIAGGLAAIIVYRTGMMGAGQNPIEPSPEPSAEEQAAAPMDAAPEAAEPSRNARGGSPARGAQVNASQTLPAQRQPSQRPGTSNPDAVMHAKSELVAPEIRETVHVPVASPSTPQGIWVTTNPPGARAILDGEPATGCDSPCMLRGAPGVHHIYLSLPGYVTELREVRVGETAVDVPPISMRQSMGTLMLTTQPPGASIIVNGDRIPQRTPAQLSLPPGGYIITVEKDRDSKTEKVQMGDSMMLLSIPLQ